MADGACARVSILAGWGMVACSALTYAVDVFDLQRAGRHAEIVASAAAALALLLYWRLVVKPRLTRRNENLLLGPLLVVAVASLAVNLACSSLVALSVLSLACGLSGVSSGSLRLRERTPGRW